jgi:hypothetical protein
LATFGVAAVGCGLLNGAFKVEPATSSSTRTVETTVPPTSERLTTATVSSPHPTPIMITLPAITIQGGGRVFIVAAETPVSAGNTRKEAEAAEGKGVGVTAPAGTKMGDLKFPPPESGVGKGGPTATGGSLDIIGLVARTLGGIGILYAIGALCILGGGLIAGLLKQFLVGAGIGGAGVVMIGVAVLFQSHPWTVFIPLGLLAVLAVWFVLHLRATAQQAAALDDHATTLGTIVKAIEAAPAGAARAVKDQIEAVATVDETLPTVKRTVTKFKLPVN